MSWEVDKSVWYCICSSESEICILIIIKNSCEFNCFLFGARCFLSLILECYNASIQFCTLLFGILFALGKERLGNCAWVSWARVKQKAGKGKAKTLLLASCLDCYFPLWLQTQNPQISNHGHPIPISSCTVQGTCWSRRWCCDLACNSGHTGNSAMDHTWTRNARQG